MTKNLLWSNGDNAGWLWTYEQVTEILEMDLENKPMYYQRCVLVEDRDDVNVWPVSEPELL